VRGELLGDGANIRIHAMHGRSKHNGWNLAVGLGRRQVAIELAPLARADPDGLAEHGEPLLLSVGLSERYLTVTRKADQGVWQIRSNIWTHADEAAI
jgi:hypothetical protein